MSDPGSPPSVPPPDLAALDLRPMRPADLPLIERLDERVFGPGRFSRSAYRLREGVAPDFNLSRVAYVGSLLIGANLMTLARCGEQELVLLGPLTVEPAYRSRGIGEALALASIEASRAAGHGVVILVGDLPYYARLGFKPVPMGKLTLPGPVDPARLLHCELRPGAFETLNGRIGRAF
ncbi:GNAT family N-acetyltransferase [Methylocella sp. CPCC 101449]|uniref:GNAT family N-acetyltransferase n=1 Tax=Methylocella sp. CPCC 101449 TaxID=2987531 RepID=UPI0039089D9E